jgi:hypothetical protein
VVRERREYQRLHLTKTLDGWFGDFAIRLLDVSAAGALIETDDEIPVGARALLRFFWRDEEVEITAETARGDDNRAGLKFVEESEVLLRLIALSATEVLRAQQANAEGQRELNVVGEETLTAASAGIRAHTGYLAYTFEDNAWHRRGTSLADQPSNGFTVSANESQEQIDLLCRTYEAGDAESRRMTRLLAEISARGAK